MANAPRSAPLVLAGLLTAAALLADARLPPRPDEPLALRWMRTAAAHPVRTAAALALLGRALAPARSAPPSGSEAALPAAAPRAGARQELG